MRFLEVVSSTAEPRFACDLQGTIVAWNAPARKFLGHHARDVVGKPCYAVLQGRDLFGNRHCTAFCGLREMARRGDPISRSRILVRTASTRWTLVVVDSLILRDGASRPYLLVHILHSIAAGRPGEDSLSDRSESPTGSGRMPLTSRELDILRLLEGGGATREIAGCLGISVPTVRNHIHHILDKLGAHSRLEAVCLARRLRYL